MLFTLAVGLGFIKNLLTWGSSYILSFTSDKPSSKTFLEAIGSSTPFYYVEAIIIAGVATILLFVWELYQRFQQKSIQAAQLETQLANAELQALKMQLQPHFLFNAHNTISMLVRTKRHEQATDMIAALSDLLRSSLKGYSTQMITLGQELELIKKYLSIEQIRFEENLSINIEAQPDLLNQPVPNFILQPIVENAIKHGASKHIGKGELNIKAKIKEPYLVIRVENTGPLLRHNFDVKSRTGIGLSNTEKRLTQLYKVNGLLGLRNENDKVVTEIKIPIDKN